MDLGKDSEPGCWNLPRLVLRFLGTGLAHWALVLSAARRVVTAQTSWLLLGGCGRYGGAPPEPGKLVLHSSPWSPWSPSLPQLGTGTLHLVLSYANLQQLVTLNSCFI